MTHAGKTTGGFFSARGASPSDAMRLYRSGLRTLDVQEPQITSVIVGGRVSATMPGLNTAVFQPFYVSPDANESRTPARGRGLQGRSAPFRAPQSPPRRGLAVAQSGDPEYETAPRTGTTSADESGNADLPRLIHHELEWNPEAIAEFGERAYEHDFRLYNPADVDPTYKRPACLNAAAMDDFWADRGNGVFDTTFPAAAIPYFDTETDDPCNEMDLTVGVYRPAALMPAKRYEIDVLAEAGDTLDSPFQVQAQALSKDCEELTPWCYGLEGAGDIENDYLPLIPKAGGTAVPGCREWTQSAGNATNTACYDGIVGENRPVAYWRLGEKSGTAALDSSGHGLHGTYRGTSPPVLGKQGALAKEINSAIGLDGGGYVERTYDPTLDVHKLTAEAWVRTSFRGTRRTIIQRPGSFSLNIEDGKAYAVIYLTDGSTPRALGLRGKSDVYDGRWHHLAMTYDGRDTRLFVDGIQEAESVLNTYYGRVQPSVGNGVLIGTSTTGTAFVGDIDEVALYDRALSPGDFQIRFANQWSPRTGCEGTSPYATNICATNPVGYWQLGEFLGEVAFDYTNLEHGLYGADVVRGKAGAVAEQNAAIGTTGSANSVVTIPYEDYGMYSTSTVTAEAWAKTSFKGTRRTVLQRPGALALHIEEGKAYAAVWLTDGSVATAMGIRGVTDISDGRWHHLAMTYGGATLRLFVDGVRDAQSDPASSWAGRRIQPSIGNGFLIGNSTATGTAFVGDIDEVAVYDRAFGATILAKRQDFR